MANEKETIKKIKEIIPTHVVFEGPFETTDRLERPYAYWLVSIRNVFNLDIKSIEFRSVECAEEYANHTAFNLGVELHNEASALEDYR